ncbi:MULTISPECIES: CaiB/BaiF CoA transferase family protein [unclassified Sphingobium]|uniref:CaiB/BaiF CoA transferase family protein n=1 Tax=unclassified Sphingobium TaxID=2611147 RepID=UPI000D156771|nr:MULTISPECIES: CoA transferase [unclassified Sphingobium]MBG6119938.1 crotonobetainyl-CoA:carnitine CoA-transferase CaiB-like acyl-CoA transferase [Sphingobium sp. JAI105]PSO11895.1 CoA transferase [Sphingobium sp. AEW4]TWC99623.1 crotonobetainyl-CoA:carnitine CoA-transferase CaiB-like acyl-CoA transferase [Sphingobium sp. AEW010]TWD18940.1 crotonobetainyl-CoA:carnitine CoA-transferase CaiB-like acyl-CoA transferase [Sphingobium sp. AEW013]TWD21811.1 crotonobetainyl-CoA:carnitine CoA-transfe
MTAGILQGIKVLDMGRYLAAPWAAQMLADLGADVVKIERVGQGDQFRQYGSSYLRDDKGELTGETAYYLCTNRNKRSITLDIADPRGQEIVRKLARRSDVLIENFRTGSLARFGLDYPAMKALNPALIYLSVTGFGQDGPYAKVGGLDSVFQAMSGLMSVTGEPDGPPQKIGVTIIDEMTGLYGANAVLAALFHRERTGQGQHIDLALFDTALAAMSHRAQDYFLTGERPARMGSRTIGSTPAQIFGTSDGAINVQAGDDHAYRAFCEAIDRLDLRDDPRFAERAQRWALRDELLPQIEDRCRELTSADLLARLQAHRVICARINNVDEAFAEPQAIHRNMRRTIRHPLNDALSIVANPIRFSETPITDYAPPPLLGADTDDVLRQWLGMEDGEIHALREAGMI